MNIVQIAQALTIFAEANPNAEFLVEPDGVLVVAAPLSDVHVTTHDAMRLSQWGWFESQRGRYYQWRFFDTAP